MGITNKLNVLQQWKKYYCHVNVKMQKKVIFIM